MYYKDEILNKDLEWLKRNYYQEILMDFSQICSEKEFHRTIKKMLDFPAYYGENMNASFGQHHLWNDEEQDGIPKARNARRTVNNPFCCKKKHGILF